MIIFSWKRMRLVTSVSLALPAKEEKARRNENKNHNDSKNGDSYQDSASHAELFR